MGVFIYTLKTGTPVEDEDFILNFSECTKNDFISQREPLYKNFIMESIFSTSVPVFRVYRRS